MMKVTEDAVTFDQLIAMSRIMGEGFQVASVHQKWTVSMGLYAAYDHDTFDAAVNDLVKKVLDNQWSQRNEANSTAVLTEGRIQAFRRIGYR